MAGMGLLLQNKIQATLRLFFSFILLIFLFTGCQSSKPNSSAPTINIDQQKIQKNNPNPEALKLFMSGQMLMNQGDYPMAIIEFQEALTFDPDVGTIYTSIAECYWNIGKPELSMKNLKIALSKNPRDEEALRIMADQLILNSKNEAKDYFNKAREKILKDVDKKRESLEKEIDEEIDRVEKEILDLKNKSPEKIRKIAVETSSDLIKQIIGVEVNNSSISAIVEDVSRKTN